MNNSYDDVAYMTISKTLSENNWKYVCPLNLERGMRKHTALLKMSKYYKFMLYQMIVLIKRSRVRFHAQPWNFSLLDNYSMVLWSECFCVLHLWSVLCFLRGRLLCFGWAQDRGGLEHVLHKNFKLSGINKSERRRFFLNRSKKWCNLGTWGKVW